MGQVNQEQVSGVIEVLNRSGQVLQRVAYNGERLIVGRAFDNDIIIGDPYICPHHLEIQLHEDKFWVRDLGSVNGSYLDSRSRRIDEAELPHGKVLHMGHSQLRYQPADMPVAETWFDTARHGLMPVLGEPWALVVSVFLAVGALLADTLLETIEDLSLGLLANELFYPLMGLLLWAGFWSLLNRIIAHRANLPVHLTIVSLGVVALFVLGHGVEIFAFAFGLDNFVQLGMTLERMIVLSLMLYAHLRFASHVRFWTGAAMAGVASMLLIGTPTASELLSNDRFSSLPELDPLLKPPVFQLRQGVSTEEFFQESRSLLERLEPETED
jgi:pSer/pThr/pTyr-binding forkhead associated (FHA) protein